MYLAIGRQVIENPTSCQIGFLSSFLQYPWLYSPATSLPPAPLILLQTHTHTHYLDLPLRLFNLFLSKATRRTVVVKLVSPRQPALTFPFQYKTMMMYNFSSLVISSASVSDLLTSFSSFSNSSPFCWFSLRRWLWLFSFKTP